MRTNAVRNEPARMPDSPKIQAWLVEDAWIEDKQILGLADVLPPEEGDVLRKRVAADGKHCSFHIWLITIGPKRLWCSFVGANEKLEYTSPMGSMTMRALAKLPNVPTGGPIMLSYITSAKRFAGHVTSVLSLAEDKSIIVFMGDMAGELDGMELELFQPLGVVKAAVELDAAGWPQEFKPMGLTY
jgi:hypothetical protein